MRAIALFGAVVMLGLGRPASASPAESPLPQGPWQLTTCVSTSYTGSRCAHLDQNLKLRVQYFVGPADGGKVLFEGKISADVAQQLYGHALSAIRAFGDTPGATSSLDGPTVILKLDLSGNTAEVHLSAEPDEAGSDVKDLIGLLRELTHAF